MYRQFKSGSTCTSTSKEVTSVISEEQKVRQAVDATWSVIKNQCTEQATENHADLTFPSDEWNIVRVFVSSTFTDFFNERETLVKKVFPDLREWCFGRNLKLIECDLRWGIPKDTSSEETIMVCLEEIDKCRETNNNKPFFLNLVGERYGWMPSDNEFPEDAKEKYGWVNGASITLMEILHGAYREQNPNAVFFMRDAAVCDEIPSKFQKRFVDTDPLAKCHLKVMKEKIQSRFPQQVYHYSCKFNQISSVSGRERVEFAELDQFAQDALGFLKNAISRMYPECEHKDVDPLNQELHLQRMFAVDLCRDVIGRDKEMEMLINFLKDGKADGLENKGGGKTSVRQSSDWDLQETDNPLCVVEAPGGWGKSSLMCRLITHSLEAQNTDVFYHIVGSTPMSNQTDFLVDRLLYCLMKEKTGNDSTQEEKQRQLRQAFSLYRDQHKKGKCLIIIIDGLNQLSSSESVHHLSWLPPTFPRNVLCIVSSSSQHLPTLARLYEHPCLQLNLAQMETEELSQLAIRYLKIFNKSLHPEQMAKLLQKKSVNSPLWMKLIAEELRVFGDYSLVDAKIENLPDTMEDQLAQIIDRLIMEDDEYQVIKKLLCLIACSRNGLPSDHVQQICGNLEMKEELPPLYLARAKRALKIFLRSSGALEDYLTFSHESVSQAVRSYLLSTQTDLVSWHTVLADFYQYWCDKPRLKVANLPLHLKAAGLKKRMVEFLCSDKDSYTYMHSWERSRLLETVRCRGLADSVIPATSVVMLCQFCSMTTKGFNPGCNWQNKMCCVLCGAMCNMPHGQAEARACMRHANRLGPTMVRCRLCSHQVSLGDGHPRGTVAKLCQHCGFGNGQKMCSAIDA